MKPVIICGGIGTKLWPLSRESCPKQFLKLFDGKSLFQLNWDALRTSFLPSDIYIQTTPFQAELAVSHVPEILKDHILIEPMMRNQGPATGFCAAKLFGQFPDDPFMLIQADVLRTPTEKFMDFIQEVDNLVRKTSRLVTGIVHLSQGVDGIDFIIPGDLVETRGEIKLYSLNRFVMRNDPDRAKLEKGATTLFGHANHYAWTPRLMLNAYKEYAREWYDPLMRMMLAFGTPQEEEVVRREYALMPAGPIESRVANYAMKDGLLVECPFDWQDLGTWDSMEPYITSTKEKRGKIEIDGSRNFVISEKTVALLGVDDLVVIETADTLFITRRGKSANMTELIDILKTNHPELL